MSSKSSKIIQAFLRLMDFEELHTLVSMEIRERGEEGYDIAGFQDALEHQRTQTKLIALYCELLNVRRAKEFAYSEPETLTAIHSARPEGPRQITPGFDSPALYDRIYGGWLGRVAGCLLGKPVEPWGNREKITRYLSMANAYPLSNYIPRLEPLPDGFQIDPNAKGNFLGEIDGAPADDDTDYTILALHILETHGLEFSPAEVASEWLIHLSYHRTWTAERTVYRNLIQDIPPTEAALVLNPQREYIGARIRSDAYGWVSPGNPEQAARLAYQDATLSHTKNGIYSAMFMAACIAWAFVTDDIEEIIRVGLSEIPANCRLAEAIHTVLAVHQQTDDWETAYDRLLTKYGSYHPVHAINNTAWMVLALLYGEGNFEKTICTAVMGGFDTDCNAANAGAVLGVLTGAQVLPSKWTGPLNDTLQTAVALFGKMNISALASRTARIAESFLTLNHPKGE